MISMDDWVTIRTMKRRNPELGTRAIAKELGIARNTVKKALKSEREPVYERKKEINPELAPHEDYICIQYCQKKLPGSRIIEDLRVKGCKVSRSAFYRYLQKLDRKNQRTYMRYETKPGEQGQFDWSPYSVMLGGKVTKIYVYCFILGFSRYRVYTASRSQTQASVLGAMEETLQQIKGVPQRVQTDNHATLVTNARKNELKWNQRYLRFTEHYGFTPTRSAVRHPWSKGKVENPFSYLENHFILDHEFCSFDDFCNQLHEFKGRVNARIHTTTQRPPKDLFSEEYPSLAPLPPKPFIGVTETFRKVSSDCMISYKGNRYTIPHIFAGKEVWVREWRGNELMVFSRSGKRIATHKLELEKKGQWVINNAHFQGYRGSKGTWTALSQRFLSRLPEHQSFLDRLKAQKRINPNRHLTKIVEAIPYFTKEAVECIIEFCSTHNVYNGDFFVELLHQRFGTCADGSSPTVPSPSVPVPSLPSGTIRPLEAYCTDQFAAPPDQAGGG